MVKIIGAGMAGLIAGTMLRGDVSEIVERQEKTPHNHSAVLRFKSDIVGNATNVQFKKVNVLKGVYNSSNKSYIRNCMDYSYKVIHDYKIRSVITANDSVVERWVAPDNFVDVMASRLDDIISYGKEFVFGDYNDYAGVPIISTLPMPLLMNILDYKRVPEFKHISGGTITCNLPDGIDVYFSQYYPDIHLPYYRISCTGNKVIIEFTQKGFYDFTVELHHGIDAESDPELFDARCKYKITGLLTTCGLHIENPTIQLSNVKLSDSKYMKMLPIDENERKRFILWASEEHNIFSLGRLATWRPGLLLDDLVNDVRIIKNLISGYQFPKYNSVKDLS